jgi:hypothetical protein
MKTPKYTTLLLFITSLLSCTVCAQEAPQAFSYYHGLMEYYAVYCDTVTEAEVEESYLALSPEKYAATKHDEANRKKDLVVVRSKLQSIVPAVRKGMHEYVVYFRSDLGEYDPLREGFHCQIVSPQSCLNVGPVKTDVQLMSEEGRYQSEIMYGLLFDKVHTLKIFFSNAEEFDFLPCSKEQESRIIRDRTDYNGAVNTEAFVVMAVELLPKSAAVCRQHLDYIEKHVDARGLESSYFLLAKIKHIEVYNDPQLQQKLGEVQPHRTLQAIQVPHP